MNSSEMAAEIASILDSKKGLDIETIDVSDKTTLADYFVICSGNSTTQIKALADEVEYVLKTKFSIYADHVEGHGTNRWILIDYKDVVVHVFHQEERSTYNLEKLWDTKQKNADVAQ